MNDFVNKVALVTGAGRGIGRRLAVTFAARGARVAANDITPINLDETMMQIAAAQGRAQAYIFEIAKKMPVQAMVEQILDDWGRIDILINHAEVEPHIPILEMDEWDWQRTLDVNLSSPFWLIQAVGRVMRTQGGGAIINLTPALRNYYSKDAVLEKRAAYVASKMGLIGLTRAAAFELGTDHIRVNAVCPRLVEIDAVPTDQQDKRSGAEFLKGVSTDQTGYPQDAIDLILFLCSDAAVHLTGQVINCNLRVR